MLLAVLKRQSPRQRYRRPRSCLVDVKAVGAVLTYAMIAQDFATLTKAKWLHTTAQHGRVATKSIRTISTQNQTRYGAHAWVMQIVTF